ncbi:ligase-associated DNA damage response endonuclease PdeM [Variovorax sp. GT1P44]|uniref:ligase-associated DNA damage response endonuclease PdeM n=1 Tax=Variovorax sp. GT1P44 TaxID=3443742 RepID=UPI003F46C5D6
MPSLPTSCRIELAGQQIDLLPDPALWWPAERVLFIADLHLGKAATFRALGQPVPSGTTLENLARLDRLIARHDPVELVFLGDFLHAAEARTPQLLAAIEAWRGTHPALGCTLVRGNHDSRAGDPPVSLRIRVVDEPWAIGPFAACHHPQRQPGHFVLAGHVHPTLKLHGRGRDSVRLRCFVQEGEQLVLPAFGEFTGGWRVESSPDRRFYAVGGDAVWKV